MLTGTGQCRTPWNTVSRVRSRANVHPLMTANPSRLGATIPDRPNGRCRTTAVVAAVNHAAPVRDMAFSLAERCGQQPTPWRRLGKRTLRSLSVGFADAGL